MPKKSTFEERLLGQEFPYRKKKRGRAEDLRDLIAESIDDLGLADQRGSLKEYGVTFDRVPNQSFDYWLFDELLVQLCNGAGGNGIRKPLHQMRVMEWKKDAKHLMRAIRSIAANYPNVRFDRLMVFRIDGSAGYRLIRGKYRK